MNLNLIRKYLPEFNSYVKGQPLLIGFKRSTGVYKWKPLVWEDWGNGLIGDFIIINDEYCTYRKAVAEGKQLQSRDRTSYLCSPTKYGEWSDTNHTSFCLPVDCYRIKPEEPEFKIGDYVRYIHANSPKPLQIVNINCERYYFENAKIILRLDEIEKWEPREGEVCIFWNNDSNTAVIAKLRYIVSTGTYRTEHSYWDNCMPFTGALPPHIKD